MLNDSEQATAGVGGDKDRGICSKVLHAVKNMDRAASGKQLADTTSEQ